MNITMDSSLSTTLNAYLRRSQRSSLVPLTPLSTNSPVNAGVKMNSPPESARELVESFYSTKQAKDFENMSLAFQCLYSGTNKREDLVTLVRKHQHYVVFLNSKMLHKLALVELSIIYKTLTSSQVPTTKHYETLLKGPSPDGDFPLLMVASFHLFVFQSLLHMISSRVQSIIKKNSSPEINLFWEISTAFLRDSNFDKCLLLCDSVSARKYYLNGLKMLSGFVKVAEFISAKVPNTQLQTSISAFKLKIIEYTVLAVKEITAEVPPLDDTALVPFVRDLRDVICNYLNSKYSFILEKLSVSSLQKDISKGRTNTLNLLSVSTIKNSPKESVGTISFDINDENSIIDYLAHADVCITSVEAISRILNSIYVEGLSSLHYPILDSCILFLKTALANGKLFEQCLKDFVPLLSDLSVKGKSRKSMQNLSRICFEYARHSKLVAGFFESCKLDLEFLSLNDSPELEVRLVNRVEYSICSLLDLVESTKAAVLTEKYITIKSKKIEGETLLNIIATCISSVPTLVNTFFGKDLSIEPVRQASLFLDLLVPLKSKLSDDACYIISRIISELPEKPLIATQYSISQLFDIDSGIFNLENSLLISDFILVAGILVNGFKNGKFELCILERIESHVSEWLLVAPNPEIIEHFPVFRLIVLTLFNMGFYNHCAMLIEKFKSSDFSDSPSLLQLELLLGRCLLEVPEIIRLPQVLKNSGTLFKLAFTSSNPDYDDLVNLKLTQFEFFVKMRDENKSKLKFEEIKLMIVTRPEYNLVGEAEDALLHRRLKCLMTVARFLLLASMFNIMLADMLRALRNLKISIKLLCSILRKLGPRSEYLEERLGAHTLLLRSYKCAFKAAKHLGLPKEAIHYISEFTKINAKCCECPLKTLNSFVSANYLMYVNKKTEALEQLNYGCSNTWDSEFLKFAESVSLTSVNFDILTMEQLETEKERLIRLFHESQKVRDTKKFVVSYLQISELVLELESLIIKRHGKGFPGINQDSLSVFEMLMKTIFLARVLMSDVSTSPATAHEIKRFDSMLDILPNKTRQLTNSPKFNPSDFSRLIECKDFLMRFSEEAFSRHLEAGTMLDVNALLSRCVYLLSFFGLSRKPEVINLLRTAFMIKDLAYSLPYVNQKALFMYQGLSDSRSLIPELDDAESVNSFRGSLKIFYQDLHRSLPDSWVVVTLDICQISGDLVISRLDNQSDFPLVVKLPFDRKECEHRGFDEYLGDLKAIIAESNRSTKSEVTLKICTKEDRKLWWTRRFELDSRLGKLLQQIERLTIGGLVGIFSTFDSTSAAYQIFEKGLNKVWKVAVGDQSKFFMLDKLFVDLYYHIGFHGDDIPSEIELLADLTDYIIEQLELPPCSKAGVFKDKDYILNEIYKLFSGRPTHNDREHLILIPSHSCGHVPWESMTFLKNRSVSRMPSVGCLVDSLKKHGSKMTVHKGDRENLLYVINPGSDLRKTQMRFEPVLSQLPRSRGLAGESPSEQWLTSNLYQSSLFIYLGHGGGEQYLRSSSLFKSRSNSQRDLPATLLMGCSSSAHHENGRLQPSSNIFNWLVCGSPAVMTNLWDVTDKDIDIFSLSLLAEWGLVENSIQERKSLAQAMIKSRDTCTLRFLNGAAPILHGLPLKLN